MYARVQTCSISSSIVPDIQRAYFECMTCQAPEEVDIVNGRIAEPTKVSYLAVSTSRERVRGDRACLGVFVVHHVLC